MTEFGLIYLEAVAGMRTMEQLNRWLGEENFLALRDHRMKQAKARALLQLGNKLPRIEILKVNFFGGYSENRYAVITFKWEQMVRAMSVVIRPDDHRRRVLTADIVGC